MAWGSHNQVFLGDEMLAAREYSDETARVIDKEIQRILVEQEKRCRDLLTEHRHALDLVARALLEHETIDGAEVARLVELAGSGPAGGPTGTENGASAPAEPVEDRSPVD